MGAGGNEEVADGGEDRDEALEAGPRSEVLYHSLSFPDWYVGILRAIVQTFVRAMLDISHDRALGGSIGSQLVGHNSFWPTSLLSQQPRQQAFRSPCVAVGLNNFIEDIPVLIDGAPKPTLLTVDCDDDLVQMPNIAALGDLRLKRRA